MTDQTPSGGMFYPQQYSPDGRFWWDGRQWIPTAEGAPPAPPANEPEPSIGPSSWRRAGIAGAIGIATIIVVNLAGNARMGSSPGSPATVPGWLLGAISLVVAISAALSIVWVASGRPGFHPATTLLLVGGLSIVASRFLQVSLTHVWSGTYQYSPDSLSDSGNYATHAFNTFTDLGLFTNSGGGGGLTYVVGVASAVALCVFLLIVAVIAVLSRRAKSQKASVAEARDARLLVAALVIACGVILLDVALGQGNVGRNVIPNLVPILMALAVIVEAVTSPASRRWKSTMMAVMVGSGLTLLIAAAWLPLILLLNAFWPLTISKSTGGGK
jgi:hypothetical protein